MSTKLGGIAMQELIFFPMAKTIQTGKKNFIYGSFRRKKQDFKKILPYMILLKAIWQFQALNCHIR